MDVHAVTDASHSHAATAGTSDDPNTQNIEMLIQQLQLATSILDQMQISQQDNSQSPSGSQAPSEAK